MIPLSVEAGDGEQDYLGKSADSLQEGVVISGSSINGILKHVTGYKQFSDVVEEQSGNYLVLKLGSESGTLTTRIMGSGASGKSVTVDDGFCVYRVKSPSQKIEVKATDGEKTTTRVYSLNGLTLRED